jgi:L-arabinonolactonase
MSPVSRCTWTVASTSPFEGNAVKIDRLPVAPDLLGESPVWDPESGSLFWVDIAGRKVRRLHLASGEEKTWSTPSLVGSIGLAPKGRLVMGLQDGFHLLQLATGAIELIARLDRADPRMRLNDGKTDRTGRFICGGMGLHGEPLGALHRLTAPGKLETLAEGIRISNAICFSPAGDRLYFADSLARKIMVYDYGRNGTDVGAPRLFLDTGPLGSAPDGATVDSEGHVWVALVEAGKIARISPKGDVVTVLDVPVEFPTCPAFGGENMDVLFVTSIKDSGGRLVSSHPDAGVLLAISGLGVRGIPDARFEMT